MVAPRRELANILNHSISKPQTNQPFLSKQHSMHIEANSPRGCSLSPSTNSLREMSANSAAFSIDYAECIQAQSENLTWTEQVEKEDYKTPLLYFMHL